MIAPLDTTCNKRAVKKSDNPLTIKVSVGTITEFTLKVSEILMRYNIRYETFRDLMTVVELYVKHGIPVSQHAVAKYSGLYNKNYSCVINRLHRLRQKGLVEVVGETVNNGKMIAPSVKALEELSELCK